jgi:endo-1,4-beta-D-glucanase Y
MQRRAVLDVTAAAPTTIRAAINSKARLSALTDAVRPTLPRLLEYLGLFAALSAAALITGLNMFHFPHYESDEGTYVASAWSMLKEGNLAYYTYNYDHPPLGWLLISVWAFVTGGFDAFGMSVNSGRMLMWFVALLSTWLIFLIVRVATERTAAALLAAVIFALSPLGITLHRQVWLDNIATFWLLVSLFMLLCARGRMGYTILSAVAFGLSFWTKEVFAVFLPGMLLLVHSLSHRAHRRFAFSLWTTTAISALSLFVLLAILKDELLPPGVLWSSQGPHVSLIETYRSQIGRGGGGSLLNPDSDFRRFLDEWVSTDPVLLLGGAAAALGGLIFGRRDPFYGSISFLALCFLLFLGRGGVTLFYYVIPVLALLALALGLLAGHVIRAASSRWRTAGWSAIVATLLLTVSFGNASIDASRTALVEKQTDAQSASTRWMVENLPRESVILMDAYGWVDMRDPAVTGGRPFTRAHYYWPGVSDPAVRYGVLHDNWRTIDYLATSPSIEADLGRRELPLVPEALANSDEIRSFTSGNWSVRIRRVRKLQQLPASADPMLVRSWGSYKAHFVKGGRVVDPKANGATTSEGQSYAMLRAVYLNDRPAFDELWRWSQRNLQRADGLLSWHWGDRPDGTQGVLDPNAASDADQDTALALLFAAKRWNAPLYQDDAMSILRGIWEEETALVGERRVLVAGNWARGESISETTGAIINPSYLAPYAYRIFAEADPDHAWIDLVDSTYDLFARVRAAPELGGAAGVVPNWLRLDPDTGNVLPADLLGPGAQQFSYDASRASWRLALDWLWFKDNRAREALAGIDLPRRSMESGGLMQAAYRLDGVPAVEYEATSMYAATLGGVLVNGDRNTALRVFADKILRQYTSDSTSTHWGDPNDYYDQNWAWFATALMNGSMSNLWAGDTTINWDQVLP